MSGCAGTLSGTADSSFCIPRAADTRSMFAASETESDNRIASNMFFMVSLGSGRALCEQEARAKIADRTKAKRAAGPTEKIAAARPIHLGLLCLRHFSTSAPAKNL